MCEAHYNKVSIISSLIHFKGDYTMEDVINIFLPDEDDHIIETLVFMDLEATGLPSFIGKKNVHITEISLVAVNRNDFETDESFRVLNKLSLCIRPRSAISHGAMSITGLYNDTLENQNEFDNSIPKLLKYFFKRLKAPVCLLAHNGNKYDFPLLQAELKRLNYILGSEILCVDTLEAIRSIYQTRVPLDKTIVNSAGNVSLNSNILQSQTAKIKTDSFSSDDEIDILLSTDMDLFTNIDLITSAPSVVSSGPIHIIHNHCENQSKDISFQNEHTPQSKSILVTGNKQLKRRKHLNTDLVFSPTKMYKLNETPSSLHTKVKKKLFSNEISSNTPNKQVINSKPLTFSLPSLYNHFFGMDPPISHYAEADCIALSKVCQKISHEFLPWIDKNSFPFNEIKEMW